MEHSSHHSMVSGEHSPKEVIKFIGVIISIIVLAALLRITFNGEFLTYFMGVFFVVFAGFKLAGYAMFKEMFPTYDVVAERSPIYAALYPFIELTLGVAYLFNIAPGPRDLITFIIMAISSIGVFRELKRRRGIHCACLGNIIKLPLSTVSLVENVGMGLMALFMLIS